MSAVVPILADRAIPESEPQLPIAYLEGAIGAVAAHGQDFMHFTVGAYHDPCNHDPARLPAHGVLLSLPPVAAAVLVVRPKINLPPASPAAAATRACHSVLRSKGH